MKRIFLSLGFSGRTEEAVRSDIDKAKELISSKYINEEIEFVHNYEYTGANRVECLGEAIKKMSTCDIVYFINNWHLSHNGSMIEKYICGLYDIPWKLLYF